MRNKKMHNWSVKYKGSMDCGYCYCLSCGITKWKGMGGYASYFIDSLISSGGQQGCEDVTRELLKKRIDLFHEINRIDA